MRIYLIGFMGSGKTHTGRRLAEKRQVPFIDLDEQVEAEAGTSISRIFEREGESGFRQRERRALHQTAETPAAVIACGGGAPCFFDNMDWINQHGLSVFLDAPVDLLLARLQEERNHRPLLRDLSAEELKAYIEDRIAQRRPFYEQARVIYLQQTADEPVSERLAEQFIHITGH